MEKRILELKKAIEDEIYYHHRSILCLQDVLDVLEGADPLDLKAVTDALEVMNERLEMLRRTVVTEQKSMLC